MDKAALIETIAIATGIIVVTIETFIILLLQKHMKALDKHICKLEESTKNHLEHLNEHSHQIEESLEKICGPVMPLTQNRQHSSTKPVSKQETITTKSPQTV